MSETSSQKIQTDETRSSRNMPGPEAPTAASSLAGEDTKLGHELGRHTLDNAERLLKYAVEAGVEVEPEVVRRIIEARRLSDGVLDNKNAGELIEATTKLAKMVKPVTIESLTACESDAKKTIQNYRRNAIILAVIIIPLSMVSFIITGISNTITAQLKIANELAVKLHTQIDTSAPRNGNQRVSAGILSDLQQFAVAMRAIYSRTQQLNWVVLHMVKDPIGASSQELG